MGSLWRRGQVQEAPGMNQNSTHTPLSMSYSGESQLRYFDGNSITHAQQKIKSLREKRANGWRARQEGRYGLAAPPQSESAQTQPCVHTGAPNISQAPLGWVPVLGGAGVAG